MASFKSTLMDGLDTLFRFRLCPILNTSLPPFTTSACARNGCASRCLLSDTDCQETFLVYACCAVGCRRIFTSTFRALNTRRRVSRVALEELRSSLLIWDFCTPRR